MQRNGPVYRAGQVPPWTPPPQPWDTGYLPEITAGMSLTREMLRYEPPVRRDPWRSARTGLIVLGAVALVAVLCGLGMFLVGQTVCPCTFGGAP